MIEIWQDVVGYEGIYRVSNLGRVKSLAGTGNSIRKEKILKGVPAHRGYIVVDLSKDGKRKRRHIHDLVMEAFVGPRPAGMHVCHTHDPTTSNNRLGNLRYDTPSGNAEDRVRHSTPVQYI